MPAPMLAGLLAVLLGASPPPPAPSEPSTAACDADRARFALGRPWTPALSERALTASGARLVRRIDPGQAVTLEHREDRLNLEMNSRGRVARVRCG